MALARVLEPEVMDTEEEAHDYDAMDHAGVNDRFCADFLDVVARAPRPLARALDVGTGSARIPIALCARAPEVKVIAVDMASHMLAAARHNVAVAGLEARIELVKMDAKRTQWEARAFDAVMSNSIVHHIPSPAEALAEMLRLVAKGGVLFVRDLARPAADVDVQRIVDMYALIPTGLERPEREMHERQRSLFDASLRAALTLDEVRALAATLGIPASSVEMTSDRHWTLAHVLPS